MKDIKNGKLVKVGTIAHSQVITAEQFNLLEQTERNINNMLRKGSIVYHKDLKIHGYVIKPPTKNTSDCTIVDLEKEMQGITAKIKVKEYDLELQWGGIMNWYKTIKTLRGRSYIFNKNAINKIEQERYKSLQTQRQFAEALKISRRNYQRMVAGETVGINTAKIIINKILKKHKTMHTSNYDSYDDLEKEFAYLNGLTAGLKTREG